MVLIVSVTQFSKCVLRLHNQNFSKEEGKDSADLITVLNLSQIPYFVKTDFCKTQYQQRALFYYYSRKLFLQSLFCTA